MSNTPAGPLRDIVACHCTLCRRTAGHFVAAAACRREVFSLVKSDTLKWYTAVPGFRRGTLQGGEHSVPLP